MIFSRGCPHGAYLSKHFVISIHICCVSYLDIKHLFALLHVICLPRGIITIRCSDRLANNQSLRWDQLDEDLFNSQLRTASLRAQCFTCNRFCHFHSSCPLRNREIPIFKITNPEYRFVPPISMFGEAPTTKRHNFADISTKVDVSSGIVYSSTAAVFATDHTQPSSVKANSNQIHLNYCQLPSSVVSPIKVHVLNSFLVDHPDRRFVNFLLNGFSSGFRIGFEGLFSLGLSNNLLSAREHPTEVSAAISKEVGKGSYVRFICYTAIWIYIVRH